MDALNGNIENSSPPDRPWRTARVYGVDYRVYGDEAGGTLYVTRYGLPLLNHLWPEQWFFNQRYTTHGQRIRTGTGTVFRLTAIAHRAHPVDFVVKFSRFAQDVPVDVRSTFDGAIDREAALGARFLDPFQEFGGLMDLRRGRFGPRDLVILTKRPLAIYRAGDVEPAWRLGRKMSHVHYFQHQLAADQQGAKVPLALDADRTYVVLFHWVRGLNLQEAAEAGRLDPEIIEPVTRRVAHELKTKGFVVYDHKPQHVIVRPRGEGLLRRHGKLAYVLIDFELMDRTEEYKRFLLSRRSGS